MGRRVTETQTQVENWISSTGQSSFGGGGGENYKLFGKPGLIETEREDKDERDFLTITCKNSSIPHFVMFWVVLFNVVTLFISYQVKVTDIINFMHYCSISWNAMSLIMIYLNSWQLLHQ